MNGQRILELLLKNGVSTYELCCICPPAEYIYEKTNNSHEYGISWADFCDSAHYTAKAETAFVGWMDDIHIDTNERQQRVGGCLKALSSKQADIKEQIANNSLQQALDSVNEAITTIKHDMHPAENRSQRVPR